MYANYDRYGCISMDVDCICKYNDYAFKAVQNDVDPADVESTACKSRGLSTYAMGCLFDELIAILPTVR